MIGEIGGTAEEEAAAFIKENVDKPCAAFIAGRTALLDAVWDMLGQLFPEERVQQKLRLKLYLMQGFQFAETPSHIAEALFKVYNP